MSDIAVRNRGNTEHKLHLVGRVWQQRSIQTATRRDRKVACSHVHVLCTVDFRVLSS